MPRDTGTTTEDDEVFQWDWDMVQMLIMFGLVLLSSVPYFYGYITDPPEQKIKARQGSGKKRN